MPFFSSKQNRHAQVRQVADRPLSNFPIIGLDIGSSAIKIAELKPFGKKWKLLRCGAKPLPPEVVMNGQIKQAEIVIQTIKDLCMEMGITTKRSAISLGGPSVISKLIKVDRMTELDMEDQIALEAEAYIPFDIEDVFLDFQILGHDQDQMDVLLTACKKELLESHTDVVRQAGLEPHICDLDLFCLSNAYRLLLQPHLLQVTQKKEPPKKELLQKTTPKQTIRNPSAVMLVNLGAAFLNIVILHQDGMLGYMRDHSFGSRLLNQESLARYGIAWAEAEKLTIMAGNRAKHTSPDTPSPDIWTENQPTSALVDFQGEIVNPFLDKLHQQIQQAIHFHKTGNPDHTITDLWISGGCALLPELTPFIHQKLVIPVHICQPLINLVPSYKGNARQKATSKKMAPLAPQFMVALGLALRGDRP